MDNKFGIAVHSVSARFVVQCTHRCMWRARIAALESKSGEDMLV